MPRKRRTARTRRASGDAPTRAEWAWLTIAPECNGFFGFKWDSGYPERLRVLWKEYEEEIRALWRETPPQQEVPHGHPIAEEMPGHLQRRPDPRGILGGSPTATRDYAEAVETWKRDRAEWFQTMGKAA